MERPAPGPGWVGIVVVNWNGADETILCLGSLVGLKGPPHRVYVVDNASTDGSQERLIATRPNATLLQAPCNLGYAGAFNLGCTRALADGADYVWLLNNDTVVDPQALVALVDAGTARGAGIYSPKILQRDRPAELWYAGGYLEWNLHAHHIGRGEVDRGQYDQLAEVAWASGCALFVAAAVARQLGPMDERYFLYLEDVDWCLRARAAGVPTYFVPAARVYHGVSRTVDRLEARVLRYYAWRNYYLLAVAHGRWWQRLYAGADLASRFAKIAARYALFPSYRTDVSYHARTRALLDVVARRFGPAPFQARADVPPAPGLHLPTAAPRSPGSGSRSPTPARQAAR